MSKKFKKYMASCIFERIDILHEQFEEQQNVKDLIRKEREFLNRLKEELPEDTVQRLLINYIDNHINLETERLSFFYKAGLEDGVLLQELLSGKAKRNIVFDIKII